MNCKEEPHWAPVIQSPGKHGHCHRDISRPWSPVARQIKIRFNFKMTCYLVTYLVIPCLPLPYGPDFSSDEKSDDPCLREMTWWDRGMMGSDCWMTSYGGHPALMSSKCEDLECVEWTSLNIDWISPFIWTGSGPSLNVNWMPQPSNITSVWSIFLNSICHVCVF